MNRINVLIVEDEQLTAFDLKERLESMGFGVTGITDNGDEAITIVREKKPDLVLMDIVISGDKDGIETANQLCELYQIPVIFLTAFADEATMQRAKKTEPFAYLVKPYNEWELKFIIEVAIYKHQIANTLRESESSYRNLAENMPGIVYRINLKEDNRIDFFNDMLTELTGYQTGEIQTCKTFAIESMVIPEDRERVKKIIERALKKDAPFELEYRIQKKDGDTRYFFEKGKPVPDDDGNPVFIEGVIFDTTERKKAEEVARLERERSQRYLEIASVMIIALKENQTVELINRKGCEVLGYKEDEIIGKNWFDHFLPKTEIQRVKVVFQQLMKGEMEPVEYFENPVLTKDGEERLIAWHNTFLKDDTGKIAGILSSGEDITERRKTEKALTESEERYRTLQENIPLGIFRATPSGEIISANPALVEMFGFDSAEQILTCPALDLYLIPAKRREMLELLDLKGVITGFEAKFKRLNGSTFWGSNNITVVRDEKGEILYFDGILENIDQRKRLEEELQKAEKLESLGLLAGGIAHDFNNILSAVLVNISLSRMYIHDNERALDRLRDAEKAIARAQGLTQRLLTFSMGGAPIKHQSSITDLLKDTSEFALSGSSSRARFDIPGDLWEVEIDRGQVSQVIQNLIINAEQSMPGGGTIFISAQNKELAEMEIASLEAGRYIEIKIIDKGIGIPVNHLDKIFDPFFTTKQKGSGLGLSTAYSIIKGHNGVITVDSRLGEGTTFHIFLPASKQKKRKKTKRAKKVSFPGTGKILLMDDDEMILTATGRLLEKLGYSVKTAMDGSETIKLYQEAIETGKPFDLVILDLVVPGGMGGKETLEKLQEITPDVKAIVSSGYSTDSIMANYADYGFAAAVCKPYQAETISQVLNNVLGD